MEEVRGSNPLTSTPTTPWSPAWRIHSVGPAPFQVSLLGSKRAATANETANRYSIAAKRRSEADTCPTFRLRDGCSASIWSAPDGSGLLTLQASSIQTDREGSRRIAWMINGMIKPREASSSGLDRRPRLVRRRPRAQRHLLWRYSLVWTRPPP